MLGWVKPYPWIWACVVTELVNPPTLLWPRHHDQLFSLTRVWGRISSLAAGKEKNWLSCNHATGANFPAPTPPGPALQYCLGKGWSQLTQAPKLAKGKANSATLMSWGLPFRHLCHQDQLYKTAQEKFRACSPECFW